MIMEDSSLAYVLIYYQGLYSLSICMKYGVYNFVFITVSKYLFKRNVGTVIL